MNAVCSEFIDATASTGSALLLTSFDDAELPELVEGPGDVPTTYADATALERDFGFTPKITLREGLRKFAEWYKEFYGHK
jgi:nucleoside-diphosphate-sugar epimerase